jgi:hypothetical protein
MGPIHRAVAGPEQESYYGRTAVVDVMGQRPITLSKPILVEEEMA